MRAPLFAFFILFFLSSAISPTTLSLPLAMAQSEGEEADTGTAIPPSAPVAASSKYVDAIAKIAKVREALKVSAGASKPCTVSKSPMCSFENLCDQFNGKAQNFYLYQDQKGHKVPNFQMIMYLRAAESCLRQPFPEAAVSDPFAYPEQLVSEKKAGGLENQKKNLENYNQQLERARSIFLDVRAKTIEMLERRRTAENSDEISNMIARIKTVKFSSPKLGDGVYTLGAEGCEAPNSFYSFVSHQLTVCPQYLNLPDAALFRVMAHEFGHAIDPCSTVFSYSKNKQGTLDVDMPGFMGGDAKPENLEIPWIRPSKNPYNSVVSCLQKPSSINAKVSTKEELLEQVDAEEKVALEEFKNNSEGGDEATERSIKDDFAGKRQLIMDNYARFKNCPMLSNESYVKEAFADWVSSQVMAEKVTSMKDSASAKQFVFESQVVWMSMGCANVGQAVVDRIRSNLQDGVQCPAFDQESKSLYTGGENIDGQHAAISDRANKVLLAKPEIRKALGCKDKPEAEECK